ncbi:hypothetical protein [Waltera sp.]|uniref:hypothetical protein n=1 Tax=Waltera sp. TaxID=2815806 RepID=UPI0039A084A5
MLDEYEDTMASFLGMIEEIIEEPECGKKYQNKKKLKKKVKATVKRIKLIKALLRKV